MSKVGDASSLIQGGTYEKDLFICNSCKVTNMRSDLMATEITHEMGSDEDIAKALMSDFRNAISQDFGVALAKLLTRWGFMAVPPDPKVLSRYLAVIAHATLKAVVEERAKIDKEKSYGR